MSATAPPKRDWRVHPGEILRETMKERGLNQARLALATGYSQKHISRLISGHVSVTATMAVRLEHALGIDAEFWMRLQVSYDLYGARLRDAKEALAPELQRWVDLALPQPKKEQ